jgi:hypothetical protein
MMLMASSLMELTSVPGYIHMSVELLTLVASRIYVDEYIINKLEE